MKITTKDGFTYERPWWRDWLVGGVSLVVSAGVSTLAVVVFR